MSDTNVLIVSDDTEFGRTIVARWQAERHVPEITLASSDLCRPSEDWSYDVVILGPRCEGMPIASFLSSLCKSSNKPVIYVTETQNNVSSLHGEYPQLLVVRREDGWITTVILVASEALRRIEAVGRAHRAERLALQAQSYAMLGRYMLEMRPSINNALTSVLGNADLLLLDPERVSEESREQIQTIHAMALRLNEIMQRFSSLACEMRLDGSEIRAETGWMTTRFAMER